MLKFSGVKHFLRSTEGATDTFVQEEEFQRREESLKRKDLELQDSMIRFSKFLQDNEAKRVRAVKKVTDERKMKEEKEHEIEQLVSDTRLLHINTCQHSPPSWHPHMPICALPIGASLHVFCLALMPVSQRWHSLIDASAMYAAKQPGTSEGADRKDTGGPQILLKVQRVICSC